jgi:hypothetical protein
MTLCGHLYLAAVTGLAVPRHVPVAAVVGGAQRVAAVDDDQDRPGHVQSPLL